MDIKKHKFNQMTKRQRFSQGGLIKKIGNRRYFDTGGGVGGNPSTTLSGPGSNTNNPDVSSNLINNFNAGPATVQAGTNLGQLQGAYNTAQGGINQQQGIATTLTPGVGTAATSQQALLNQLQTQAAGGGPNPAQTQLAQNTAANTANTAALMAGQRGASSNVGLAARQIGQQGALTQQNAVGQAATLEAQQQLQFQQQEQTQQAQMVNEGVTGATAANTAEQNEQNILQNANTAYNNAGVSMQNGINAANAATSAANSGMIGQLGGGLLSGAAAGLIALAAKGGAVSKLPHMAAGGVSSAGPALQAPGTAVAGAGGPGAGASYAPTGSAGEASQTAIPNLGTNLGINDAAVGKAVASYMSPSTAAVTPQAPIDVTSQTALPATYTPGTGADAPITSEDIGFAKGGNVMRGPNQSHVANFLMASGGKVPAMVSPGEIYLNPDEVKKVVHEGANPLKIGKKFLGKPKVKGDSLKNDTVPADLEEGGVVIPRHIMNKKDSEKAELFVRRAVHMHKPGGK
jgi:hypothetical protein